MKRRKLSAWMVFVFLAAILFSACPVRQSAEDVEIKKPPEKPGPPIFRLRTGTLLEKNYTERIIEHNDKLSILIIEVREGLILDEAVWKERMGGTYLKNPTLTEDGEKYEGIGPVISRLNAIIKESSFVDIKNTHVELEYLPYGSEKWKNYNPVVDPAGNPGDEIDMIAHIRTTLFHRSNPGDFDLSGTAPHRRICEPI